MKNNIFLSKNDIFYLYTLNQDEKFPFNTKQLQKSKNRSFKFYSKNSLPRHLGLSTINNKISL